MMLAHQTALGVAAYIAPAQSRSSAASIGPAVRIAVALSLVRKDNRTNSRPIVGISFLGTRF